MNFFQFLQDNPLKSRESNDDIKDDIKKLLPKTNFPKLTQKNDEDNGIKNLYTDFSPKLDQHNDNDNDKYIRDINIDYKIGDFITIVRSLKNSKLNYYKGYIGEIKSYSKFSNNAYVILDALNSNRLILFPIEHLMLRNTIKRHD